MDNRYQPQGIDNTLTLVLINGKLGTSKNV